VKGSGEEVKREVQDLRLKISAGKEKNVIVRREYGRIRGLASQDCQQTKGYGSLQNILKDEERVLQGVDSTERKKTLRDNHSDLRGNGKKVASGRKSRKTNHQLSGFCMKEGKNSKGGREKVHPERLV